MHKKPWFWLSAIGIILLITVGFILLTNEQHFANKQIYSSPIAKFDKINMQEYWLETVVITDCLIKDGPGDIYKTIGNLKYGDIVNTSGKYNGWIVCSMNGGKQEFWIKSTDLIAEKKHKDYNLGIITVNHATVGTITLNKGNLVQILKRDKDKSCVTIRVIDVNMGKTGWINNKDYTIAKPGVFFNQAYLKKETVIYEEPSLKAQTVDCPQAKDGTLFVNINGEKDDWMSISSFGPIDGWVQKKNIYIPMPLSAEEEKEKALKVVREYFDAFAKIDYNTMRDLATDYHNQEIVHSGDVWGMKWARATEIKYSGGDEGKMRFGVSVDMETVKTSAQYPSTRTFFFIELLKGEDGIWRVNRYSTG